MVHLVGVTTVTLHKAQCADNDHTEVVCNHELMGPCELGIKSFREPECILRTNRCGLVTCVKQIWDDLEIKYINVKRSRKLPT